MTNLSGSKSKLLANQIDDHKGHTISDCCCTVFIWLLTLPPNRLFAKMSEKPAPGTPGNTSGTLGDGYGVAAFLKGYHMTPGDYGSLTQLFFDNLSTLLGALFAIQDMEKFGVPREAIDKVVWGKIVPGVGVTLFLGNGFYTWQAIRL